MRVASWQFLNFILFVLCFASFTWGTYCFFLTRGSDVPIWGKATRLCTVLLVTVQLMLFLPKEDGSNSPSMYVAAGFYTASLLLFWSAVQANRERPLTHCFSQNEPEHIIMTGPYRLIRHPFYVSYLIAWTAGIFAADSTVILFGASLMLFLYWRAAYLEEEAFLNSKLRDTFIAYKATTGFFLPKLTLEHKALR